ncbi:MAG: YigZ family protein [Acholeplasma sp.]|nr:YigZ family protein [Acholeplasma sp.]
MKYLKAINTEKLIINKSEFISILYPISNDEDILNHIKETKKLYPKATHYVTAWVRGENGEYASSNDDGEPSRTAGYPALEMLMQHKITDCLCVIVRYFGGTKLGAGGLVRAYRSSAVKAIDSASFYNKIKVKRYNLIFPYSLIDSLEHILNDNVQYIKKEYLDNVIYEVVFLNSSIDLLDNIKHQITITELPESIIKIDI